MIVKVQGTKPNESFERKFWVQDIDSEGYREVMVFMDGGLYWYGDWNPSTHSSFQEWIDFIFRPGTVRVTWIQEQSLKPY